MSACLENVADSERDPSGAGESLLHTVRSGQRVLGFLAIDSTIGGRARGGLRMVPDLSPMEIQSAARAMTLKYGFLGLPQGGAKAGLCADAEAPDAERRHALLEFGRAIEPLLRSGHYTPDADLGTTAADVRWLMETLGLPLSPRDWRHHRSAEYTAHSCLAAARGLFGTSQRTLAQSRVAIEGFGNVGTALALLMHRAGAAVVAVSTSRGGLYDASGLDVERLVREARNTGSRVVEQYTRAERIQCGALLELPVDLLCPCARYHSVHAGNAARVQASAVCAGANDPVSPEAQAILAERGIVYLPDFISNCGGVLGGTLEFAGVVPARIADLIQEQIRGRVAGLLSRAAEQGVSLRVCAEGEALTRHDRVRAASEHPGLIGRALGLGIAAYRRGWLPAALMGRLAPAHVVRRMDS